MNVIAFRKPQIGAWSEAELRTLGETLDIGRRGQGWDTGMTENGDAQFYLLGPDQACTLCVSRVNGLYVLEDGRVRCCSSIAACRWWRCMPAALCGKHDGRLSHGLSWFGVRFAI